MIYTVVLFNLFAVSLPSRLFVHVKSKESPRPSRVIAQRQQRLIYFHIYIKMVDQVTTSLIRSNETCMNLLFLLIE